MNVKHFQFSAIGSRMILKIALKVFLRIRNHRQVAIHKTYGKFNSLTLNSWNLNIFRIFHFYLKIKQKVFQIVEKKISQLLLARWKLLLIIFSLDMWLII